MLLLLLVLHCALDTTAYEQMSFWLTNPNQSVLFRQQDFINFTKYSPSLPIIEIDDSKLYQEMDGFGFCLTGGSAMLLSKMDEKSRANILHELFATDAANIGVSYLRVSIGASDLDERVFSYDDLPPGQTDPELDGFSLAADEEYLIPVLKEIIAIFPGIKILGTPWSPPVWMKTNLSTIGGSLEPEFYKSYALYLVKYVQGMRAHGIRIDAITVQNEPLNLGNNPSMYMPAEQEAVFIKKYLGPMFKTLNIDTKIIIYDHNADRPDYPISILNDTEARKYIDGSAFHLYAGSISALSAVHYAHPDKNIYFTEQYIGAPPNWINDIIWHVKNLIIGASLNWSRTVLEWNIAADAHQNPHTPGGCDSCLGGITIEGNKITRNPGYYIIAVASKFVRPGSIRISSSDLDVISSVAFLNPNKSKVAVVLNDSDQKQIFAIKYNGEFAICELPALSLGTYVWN